MKNKSTTIIFVSTIILAIISISFFVFFIQVIRNKNEHASATSAILLDKKKQKQNSDLLAQNVKDVNNSKDKINSYLVDPSNIDIFISKIEDIGYVSGSVLTVKDVAVLPDDLHAVSVGISIVGNFSQVFKALQLIEFSPYQINFKNIYLNKNIDQSILSNNLNIKPAIGKNLWQVDASFEVISNK